MVLYSIIITTAYEHKLLTKCIESINPIENYEILIIAPDKNSEKIAKKHNCIYIKDKGKGKIAALNLSLKHAKGDILIFTDGDCVINNIEYLQDVFDDKKIGLATGKVIPKDKIIKTKWNFFHSFLLNAADYIRKKEKFIEATGYLMAVRKKLIKEFPYDVAEDSWLSTEIYKQGYNIAYVPNSTVAVMGPQNVKDWVNQKTRTAMAHEKQQGIKIKTFKNEIIEGLKFTLKQKLSLKELFIWLPQLYVLRLYVWLKVKILTKNHIYYKDGWKPVMSTKL